MTKKWFSRLPLIALIGAAVNCLVTPIRVVCNNTLNLAMKINYKTYKSAETMFDSIQGGQASQKLQKAYNMLLAQG